MLITFTEQPASNNVGNETTNDSFPFIVFGLPIAIVVFVTWLKYNIGQRLTSREFGNLLLDLCVDTLTVGVTILVAYYNLINQSSILYWIGVFLAVIILFVIHVRSYYVKGDIPSKYIVFWIVLCCITSFGVMFGIYKNVC